MSKPKALRDSIFLVGGLLSENTGPRWVNVLLQSRTSFWSIQYLITSKCLPNAETLRDSIGLVVGLLLENTGPRWVNVLLRQRVPRINCLQPHSRVTFF